MTLEEALPQQAVDFRIRISVVPQLRNALLTTSVLYQT